LLFLPGHFGREIPFSSMKKSSVLGFVLFFGAAVLLHGQEKKASVSLPPPDGVVSMPDIVYTTNGEKLLLDIALPKDAAGPMPAVVFVHGGAWTGGDRLLGQASIYRLAQAGMVGASIDYRLGNRVSNATLIQMMEDCKCSVRFLRANAAKYHIDAAHIAAMGSSAGGQLVSLMGVTNGDKEFEGDGGWAEQSSDVQAVVDWFGAVDLAGLAKSRPQTLPRLNSLLGLEPGAPADQVSAALNKVTPAAYVAAGRSFPPFLILQGDSDKLVSPQTSQDWAKALSAVDKDVTLKMLPGEGHGLFTLNNVKWWPDVIAFLKRTLG
jgi:acetyl esterase/lipase